MQNPTVTGTVSWFDPGKRFGFVRLSGGLGDAFLHFDVLKQGGYYFVPRGTTVQVRAGVENGRQRVLEVVGVDTSTAREGEPPPLARDRSGA